MDKPDDLKVNKEKFNFKYLPAYASYLLDNKLREFVIVMIRFAREEQLPMMKPLSRTPEEELVNLFVDSYRSILKGLIKGTIDKFIEQNLEKFVTNTIHIIDNSEINIEDMTKAFYVRRKAFAYFLYGYTQNPSLQQSITSEVDIYTSQEELLILKAYMLIQKGYRPGNNSNHSNPF